MGNSIYKNELGDDYRAGNFESKRLRVHKLRRDTRAICGSIVASEKRMTTEDEKVSCKSCLLKLRAQASAISK